MKRLATTETVYADISDEEKARLIGEAYTRVEHLDGVDVLDGHSLPPDNEDTWEAGEPFIVEITDLSTNPPSFRRLVGKESVLTNSYVRHINVGCIAIGHEPLFKRRAELNLALPPRETFGERIRDMSHRVIESLRLTP